MLIPFFHFTGFHSHSRRDDCCWRPFLYLFAPLYIFFLLLYKPRCLEGNSERGIILLKLYFFFPYFILFSLYFVLSRDELPTVT